MGRTVCTEPQCMYKGALYLLPYMEADTEVVSQANTAWSLIQLEAEDRKSRAY